MGLLALAVIMIFKVRTVYPEEIKYNEDLGKNHIRVAYHLLGEWSMVKDDEPSRLQRLIEVLSRAEEQLILSLKDLQIRHKPGSGLMIINDLCIHAKSLREKVGVIVSEDDTTTRDLRTAIRTQPQTPMFLGPQDNFDIGQLS